MTKTSLGIEENFEAALCYLFVWFSGLFFYFVEDKNQFIRFHALQSILVFLPLMIFAWVFGGVFGFLDYGPALEFLDWISWVFWVLVIVMWLVLMVKAYQMQRFKIPIVGDIAEERTSRP